MIDNLKICTIIYDGITSCRPLHLLGFVSVTSYLGA